MTIYLVQYKEIDNIDGTSNVTLKHFATSSYTKGTAKVRELEKTSIRGIRENIIIEQLPGEKVQKWLPKTQADVILMLNTLSS